MVGKSDPSTRGAGDYTNEIKKALQPTGPNEASPMPTRGPKTVKGPEVNSGMPPAPPAANGPPMDTLAQLKQAHANLHQAAQAHADNIKAMAGHI